MTMAKGGAAASKPVMPFYTLNLKTQEKVLALEEKWQVHFDWLTDVVAEAKVKYAKPGEERELSLLTQTPGPKRTRTARKNKASHSQTGQDQVETDAKSRTTIVTNSRSSRTTKAAQKRNTSALEENQNKENSDLSTPDSKNEKSNSSIGDPGAGLVHQKSGLRVEDTNESSSEKGEQNEASKTEDPLLKTPILEPTEDNDEINVKNKEISFCPREDDTLELVLEKTNKVTETTTEQQEHGEHAIHESKTMDERSIEIEEPVSDPDETDEVFKPMRVEMNGSLVKTSEECKDEPEIENNETEHAVEIVKKSFQSDDTNEDFVDDVFETTNEMETNRDDVQNDNLLHANKNPANKFADSVAIKSTSLGKSISSTTVEDNSQLVSPLPATIANATFTVDDDEIEFRREADGNVVNSTFVLETHQSVTSQVDDTVNESLETVNASNDKTVSAEVNETADDSMNKSENRFGQPMSQIAKNNGLNIQSGISQNLVESNEVASPSEKIPTPQSVVGSTIGDEQDSIIDKENSKIENDVPTNVNEVTVDATHPESSSVKQKPSACVSSLEDDNSRSTSSPTASSASPNVISQDQVSSEKSVGKSSKKKSITFDVQDRAPTKSGKGQTVRQSVPSSSNSVSQHESSKVRETRSSRSSRNTSTKESVSSDQQDKPPTRSRKTVSQDGEEKFSRSSTNQKDKSVRSTRSKQKQNELEESGSAKVKENHSQPPDGQKKSDTTSSSSQPGDSHSSSSSQPGDNHSSQSGSDNDEAPSTRNDRSCSVLQQKSASRRSRRSSIASSLLKVSAARKHSVVELLQTMEGSLVTLVSADSPAKASAIASKSNGTSQGRAKAGKVSKPKKAATRGIAPASRGVTPGSTYRGMTPGTMGSARTTPGVVGGSRTTPGSAGGSRTTSGSIGGSRTTPGSVGSHNGGRVRSRLGIMEKANRETPGKAAAKGGATSSLPNRSRHPSASEQMEEEKKMQEKAVEALKKKEELMKQKTDEQRNKREARIKRVQEARQAKEHEIKKKNEVKEAEEKLVAQAKRDKKLKEDAEKRRINEEQQKVAEEKEEQAMIALAAELRNKEAALEAELRNREAAEQAKKIREEEERRREREKKEEERRREREKKEEEKRREREKEEERRLQAEAKQREAEKIAREKENLRKAQAEELKEKSNLNSTYTKPSSALNQSKGAGPSSYNMTPSRHAGNLPPEPLENENDYGLDDLDSEGSTDDEDQPRKEVPKWAEGGLLRTALLKQSYMGPDLDAIFATIEMPELTDMFEHQRKRFLKRTSSAVWDTAPNSFKHGQR